MEINDGPLDARELGQTMREMRVALNRDIAEVAAELRIRLVYLKAIEEGRLDDLPGPAYTTGFLRTYAEYLGFDADEIIERFKEAGAVKERRTSLVLPSPVEEGRLPTGSVFMVALVLSGAVYGGWYYFSSYGKDPMQTIAEIPNDIRAMIGVAPGERIPVEEGPPATGTLSGDTVATAPPSMAERESASDAKNAAVAAPAPRDAEVATKDRAATAPDPVPPSPPVNQPSRHRESVAPPPAAPERETAAAAPKPPAERARPEPQPAPPVAEAAAPSPPLAPAGETRADETRTDETRAAGRTEPPPPDETPRDAAAAPADPSEDRAEPESRPPADETVAAVEEDDTRPEPESIEREVTDSLRRIVLRATADSWVEVRNGDDATLFSQLMHKGDIYEVPNEPGLKMMTGNAGGIDIVLDGEVLPPLGPTGGIRKDVALDPGSLESLAGRR